MNMRSKSTSDRCTTSHAMGWSRATRWIVGVVCGLLLALVSASTALASATPARAVSSAAAIAAHPAHAAHGAVLTHQPTRGSDRQCPHDSDDICVDSDEDPDDECTHANGLPRSCQLSVEEALGQGHSPAPAGPLTPDERTPATQFLIDSVRRM
jgi:hypothetical protein